MSTMNAEAAYIRDAISREEYPKALVQWNAYARQLRQAIEAGGLSEQQMKEAGELFEWSRQALLGARAHLRDRFHTLEVAAAYQEDPVRRRGSLETRL